MGNRWHEVWSTNRLPAIPADGGIDDTLVALLEADGFRSSLCTVSPAAWTEFAESLIALLDIRPGERIFEIGCGAGALLYPLWRRGLRVAGLDYSPSLLDTARKLMPGGEFHHVEAIDAPKVVAEHVISFSVFFYFPDLGYVEKALGRAFSIATRSVAILDLPDLATRDAALAARMARLGEAEYQRRYAGLDHLYFDRSDFVARLNRPGWHADSRSQWLGGYIHAPWRFNAWARWHGSP